MQDLLDLFESVWILNLSQSHDELGCLEKHGVHTVDVLGILGDVLDPLGFESGCFRARRVLER